MESEQNFLKMVLSEMTDPVFLHLRVNHFPIILIMVGFAAGVVALFLNRDKLWSYALVSILIAGLTAPIAYWTGTHADEAVEDSEVLDLEMMGRHEDSAQWAFAALAVSAAVAGLALAKPTKGLRIAAVGTAFVACGLTAWTGAQAGHIAHGSYTNNILK